MKVNPTSVAAVVGLILMGCGGKSAPPQASAAFLVAKTEIAVGEAPVVSFAAPLVEVSGEQYWMTVVPQGEPDSQWGQWQYVSAGTTNVTLSAPPEPGAYEVRLHDGYSRLPFHVVHRVSITVGAGAPPPAAEIAQVPSTEPVAASAPASEPAAPATVVSDPANPFKGLDFKTEKEVLAAVGPPTATLRKQDRVCWYYDREVPSMGEKGRPELHFMEGEVRATVYYPASTMSDLIATARLLNGIEPSRPTAPRPKAFTFEEAFPLASGKTKSEIIRAFGEPTMKRILAGKEVWQYDDLVREAGRNRLLAIQFEGEVAADVQGM